LTGAALGIASIVVFGSGCELVAGIDRTQIGTGGGTEASVSSSSTSTSSSSSSTGMGGGGMGGTGGMGGMGGGMGGMGGGPVCMVAADCPAPANECITVDCVMGACVETNVTADTPTSMQMAGDCKKSVCDGNGSISVINDDADTVTDNKTCTKDTCSNGMPAYPPENAGLACNEGGGKLCDGAGKCVECNSGADCMSNVCQGNVCQAAACGDMVKNGTETDIDCGGSCGACVDGKMCGQGTDCVSQVCTGMTCAAPSCTDTKKNGTETDVDCGSTCPNDCADGKGCKVDGDCQSGFCNPMTNVCAAPACNDGFKNGSETDTDCGGSCMTDCMNGQGCMGDGDCMSTYCNAMMQCAAPTCMDMVKNGDETDVDCGGSMCVACMNGQGCGNNTDCTSTYCNSMMTCATPTCTDMAKNGSETDVDCGGPMCNGCVNGKICNVNGDCTGGYCNAMVCATATCSDMVQNGTETGVDCGGSCPSCNGATCMNNTECASGMCYAGACVANVNGCDIKTAQDFTVMAPPPVTFANGNFTYAPKCIKVKAGANVVFNGNFVAHPNEGGIVSGGVKIPDTAGPFIPFTDMGTTKTFTMTNPGTFPYYCRPHALGGMTGAVFVVP